MKNASHFYHKYNLNYVLGCDVDESLRVEGGYFGITETECLETGMCWKECYRGPQCPWCYRPISK